MTFADSTYLCFLVSELAKDGFTSTNRQKLKDTFQFNDEECDIVCRYLKKIETGSPYLPVENL